MSTHLTDLLEGDPTVQKVLLIEADVSAGEDILTAAAELGVEAHVATHEDVFRSYRPELKAKISGTVFTDFADPQTALDDLARFCRETGIDGIVACWEFLSPLATRLADRLGLPGHRPELADACRNKRLMAEVFAAHGVPAPRTVVAQDPGELARRVAESGLGFPLVVKPAENAASIGVSVVRSPAELPEAARLAQSQTHKTSHGLALDITLLAQEHVDGDEFSVESVIFDGEIHHLTITEKLTTGGTSRAELGHTVPADTAPAVGAALYAAATAAIRALGLRNGVAHTEVKVSSGGAPKVIEVGARPPGDHIMRLVREALGIDEARACLQTVLGLRPDVAPRRGAAAAIRFITAPGAGVLRWTSALPCGDHVIATAMSKMPGDEVGGPYDNMGRIGQIMLRGATAAEVNKVAAEAMEAITVEMVTQW
ncbi:ATP-grasp domain-containing protein [Streptomyces sp. NBC_01020]|uniref:ATP-grasp domain-containing protein n=1 Tax=unclassified Streptomyces TaxID=2593676 RepID=UPI00324805EB|nr:ATP-grasp domain-containing protein [Streptomyces sp. NBC_01020]